MIAVIFELEPKAQHTDQYFELAGDLKPLLEQIDGFISIERFQSLNHSGRYLSLSFWENEEAVSQWRNQLTHRQAQQAGRDYIFKDYRLRVAEVLRDYGLHQRDQTPDDSRLLHG
ncbi:antibiotic biosynthesis monooxygenase [Aestuariirhabdus sp. Z084]|uniref:antibiotic biosynthesis monooxygenase family protein n=1 Tax=Aestuariirhabdus haliotis TaxID=2918751 RepID=UPI00201B3BDC|nr:antibiotic biosynthesis monooxygenase [Aestuariirhabdus haliotis]MCL6417065.1 antibiotic biosynthesis monooxygenase [Aestuariirhabdus haliotis]MCL6420976.1 antibiotic biosynthesis monooxygenase [Aestuariirhabdus haliotis]